MLYDIVYYSANLSDVEWRTEFTSENFSQFFFLLYYVESLTLHFLKRGVAIEFLDSFPDDIAGFGEDLQTLIAITFSQIPVPVPIPFAEEVFGGVHAMHVAVFIHPRGDDACLHELADGGVIADIGKGAHMEC